MFHLDNNSGISAMPKPAAQQSSATRWFTEGGGNNSPSWPGQDWFNIVQAELLNVLTAAGIAPEKTAFNQLALAIKAIINKDALLKDNLLSEIRTAGASSQKTARENLDITDATLNKKGLTQLSNAVDSTSEAQSATSKAVKIAMDNANARLAKDRNGADIPNVALFLQNVGLGAAAKSSVVQTTGQSEKDVISQKGATDNFALKSLLDNFGGATLLFNKSKDYSLQLSDAGALSLYSKALDKVVLAFSPSGELQAGTIGFEHVKELKSAAKRDVGNSAGQIPDMGYFELSGIGTDNMIAKFPNRLIIQVFRRSISNSASVGAVTINTVTFPTPFPGAVWGVFCTKMTYTQINTSCENVTNTGFSATTCAVSGAGSATSSNAVFVAFGY